MSLFRQAPTFWSTDGTTARLLAPLGALYGWLGRRRMAAAEPWRAPAPVICVGNLTAGGSGKTPSALLLARLLRRLGRSPQFLTRGHGGRERGPLQVDPARHSVDEVGDEALLLVAAAPTWLAVDRAAGAQAMADAGAEIVVMDDGFQNPYLYKDMSILVFDAGFGLGNGRLIPAGPLRERPDDGYARADMALIVRSGQEPMRPLDLPPSLPRFDARMVPTRDSERFIGQRVLGFAGIGRPAKFAASLRDLGAELVDFQAFPDHHAFAAEEVMEMIERAVAQDAVAVTTAKDAVRLPAEAREMVEVVEMDLQLDAEADFLRELTARLAK